MGWRSASTGAIWPACQETSPQRCVPPELDQQQQQNGKKMEKKTYECPSDNEEQKNKE
jgi:hypothetical protein